MDEMYVCLMNTSKIFDVEDKATALPDMCKSTVEETHHLRSDCAFGLNVSPARAQVAPVLRGPFAINRKLPHPPPLTVCQSFSGTIGPAR
ncbi:MAG: hypothetical protein AAFQ59_01240 [Pseudomonadota bacterium]